MGLIYLICLMGMELMELCERRDDAGVYIRWTRITPLKGVSQNFDRFFYASNPAELLANFTDDPIV